MNTGGGSAEAAEIIVPLLAEELAITKRRVETATVRVTRTSVTTDRLVDEELWRTSVVVERLPSGRIVEAVPPVREEGDTIIIPVVEEILVVTRQLVLKEEIRIKRVKTTSRHVETVTLREQQATIERHEPAPDPAGVSKPDTPTHNS